MKNNNKIEMLGLAITIVLYFLLLKGKFPSSIYLFGVLFGAIYFFPIKVFLKRKDENLTLTISSCFLTSLSLILSYVSYSLGDLNNTMKIILLSLTVFNLFLLFTFNNTGSKSSAYMHLLLGLLLVSTFFK